MLENPQKKEVKYMNYVKVGIGLTALVCLFAWLTVEALKLWGV